MMLLLMFSLAGMPPTVGFYAKLSVLQAAVDAGYTWLAVVAVLLSLIGAFYYLRIVKLMYFDAPTGEITIDPRADTRWMLSATAIATLVLGIAARAADGALRPRHHRRRCRAVAKPPDFSADFTETPISSRARLRRRLPQGLSRRRCACPTAPRPGAST